MPYLLFFLNQRLQTRLHSATRLRSVLQAIDGLLQNPFVDLDRHTQNLMPMLLSCLLVRDMASTSSLSHTQVRRQAGGILATALSRFQAVSNGVHERVVKELIKGLDAEKPFTTQYGAIVGLSCLDICVMPHMGVHLASTVNRLKDFVKHKQEKDEEYELAVDCRDMLVELLHSASAKSEAFRKDMADSMSDVMEPLEEDRHVGEVII